MYRKDDSLLRQVRCVYVFILWSFNLYYKYFNILSDLNVHTYKLNDKINVDDVCGS